EGERGDREEEPAQAERETADRESEQAGGQRARHDHHEQWRLQRLVEKNRGVRAGREERRRAEVHVAGVAAQDVPCRREDDELQHRVRRGEEVIVGNEPARGNDREGDRERGGGEGAVAHRPSNPDGLKASAARSSPNDTAGAHDGPKNVDVNDSASPSTNAPSSVPQIEPMPPSTETANTKPMYSRPRAGCTGWMTIRNAPATPAVAIESANASPFTRVGLTPIRRSASWSCATANTARPKNVCVRNSCTPTT